MMMKTQEKMAKNSLKKIAIIGTTLAVLGTSMAGCRSTPRSRAFGDFVTREMVKSAIHRDSNTTNVNVYNQQPKRVKKSQPKKYDFFISNNGFYDKDNDGKWGFNELYEDKYIFDNDEKIHLFFVHPSKYNVNGESFIRKFYFNNEFISEKNLTNYYKNYFIVHQIWSQIPHQEGKYTIEYYYNNQLLKSKSFRVIERDEVALKQARKPEKNCRVSCIEHYNKGELREGVTIKQCMKVLCD